MLWSYNGIVHSHDKEWIPNIHNNMDESDSIMWHKRSKAERHTVSFYMCELPKQKADPWWSMSEWWRVPSPTRRCEEARWRPENVLYIDPGGVWMRAHIRKTSLNSWDVGLLLHITPQQQQKTKKAPQLGLYMSFHKTHHLLTIHYLLSQWILIFTLRH